LSFKGSLLLFSSKANYENDQDSLIAMSKGVSSIVNNGKVALTLISNQLLS